MASRFSEGQIIKFNHLSARIISYMGKNFHGEEEYMIEYVVNQKTERVTDREILKQREYEFYKKKKNTNCECGAWITGFPDFHSDWCILHRKKD